MMSVFTTCTVTARRGRVRGGRPRLKGGIRLNTSRSIGRTSACGARRTNGPWRGGTRAPRPPAVPSSSSVRWKTARRVLRVRSAPGRSDEDGGWACPRERSMRRCKRRGRGSISARGRRRGPPDSQRWRLSAACPKQSSCVNDPRLFLSRALPCRTNFPDPFFSSW